MCHLIRSGQGLSDALQANPGEADDGWQPPDFARKLVRTITVMAALPASGKLCPALRFITRKSGGSPNVALPNDLPHWLIAGRFRPLAGGV